MPRIPKQIVYIDGVKHWDCYMCKKILPFSEYCKPSTPASLHPAYCKKCKNKKSRKSYVPKVRQPYKKLIPDETPDQILKALQTWDPSWTMEKLNLAKRQVA